MDFEEGDEMRIRTIKPDFFKHDKISELKPLARLLFIALWCLADRRGRLEDRPKRIKVECLPYDECDVDGLLWELHSAGFLDRYEIDGVQLIEISSFEKHQRISGKEAESESDYPEKQEGSIREAPGCFTESQERKGRERKGKGKERNIATADAEAIYQAYPRKEGKGKALPAIEKALKIAPAEVLLEAVQAFAKAKAGTDPQFLPHPASWFNARRWEDDRASWLVRPAGAFTGTIFQPITVRPGDLDGIPQEAIDRL